jgi:hypothetical protein
VGTRRGHAPASPPPPNCHCHMAPTVHPHRRVKLGHAPASHPPQRCHCCMGPARPCPRLASHPSSTDPPADEETRPCPCLASHSMLHRPSRDYGDPRSCVPACSVFVSVRPSSRPCPAAWSPPYCPILPGLDATNVICASLPSSPITILAASATPPDPDTSERAWVRGSVMPKIGIRER